MIPSVIAKEIGGRSQDFKGILRTGCLEQKCKKLHRSFRSGRGKGSFAPRPCGVLTYDRHVKNDRAPEAHNILSVDLCGRAGRFRATLNCLRFDAARVLKNTLGAGVMNEMFAANQPLSHEHLAPGAEAIG